MAVYLKTLCNGNSYIIRNTPKFPTFPKQRNPVLHDKEYVSYNAESFFIMYQYMKLLIVSYMKSMSKENWLKYVPN